MLSLSNVENWKLDQEPLKADGSNEFQKALHQTPTTPSNLLFLIECFLSFFIYQLI